MSIKERDLITYLIKIKELFNQRSSEEQQLRCFEDVGLKELESVYIFDLLENQIVFHQGFEKVFGFSSEMINLPLILNRYHPEDGLIVKGLIKSLLEQVLEKPVPEGTELMRIVYRFMDAGGHYRNILSNTFVCKLDESGRIQRFMIKYTDLDFLDKSDIVEWWVNEKFLDQERMLEDVYGERRLVFTGREIDVVREMISGKTNMEIAEILNISEHTVSTHRKNIFYKACCNEVVALHKFCKSNGILIN